MVGSSTGDKDEKTVEIGDPKSDYNTSYALPKVKIS